MLDRRRFTTLSASALASPFVLPRGARAAEWPSKEVKILVGFEPGGATDIIARALAERLKTVWNQPVAVENKPGAGGNPAAELVARSLHDGHTILIAGPGQALNKFMYPKLDYDPVRDFEPVSLLVMQPNVMAVPVSSPVRSVKDFIEACKANPGKETYASSGVGTSLHLSGVLFQHLTGVRMEHVPFTGSAAALLEFLPGRIDVIFDNVTSILPHVMAGGARGLAVTTAKRLAVAPNLPTLIEAGVPGFDVSSWFGFFVPNKTPKAIVDRMNKDVVAALAHDSVKPKLLGLGCEIVGSTPDALEAHVKAEMTRWGPVIAEAKIRIEK
jgi:tripartite-type tricarboxylate transporter receptor subunit TctC